MGKERKRILIVEDQLVNRKVLRKILQAEYDIAEAENGKEAFEILEKDSTIIAILLDLVMPIMNGYEFLDEIKNTNFINIPIIVMTAEQDLETEQRVLDMGAWDFVSKPFQPKTIMSRLKNAIARSRLGVYEQLKHMLEYDQLTGLYNRTKMFTEMKHMMSRHPDTSFVFVRCDVDNFRLFNSSMGEKEGDKLLIHMAKTLEATAKEYDYAVWGRLDADVFCICEPYDEERLSIQLELVKEDLVKYAINYSLKPSFGICVIEDKTLPIEVILTRAAMAVRENCKGHYMSYVGVYDSSMGEQQEVEQVITNEMQQALDEKQFVPYLQPKYNLVSNTPCGAEALVRWKHPEKGMISPGEFIPIFEKNGFISKLDYYMWEQVCILLKKWIDEGTDPAPVSVNISRVSLYNPHVVELLVGLVEKYQIPVELLNLEVTESAYMSSPELMKDLIRRLQQAGFIILMDDFGSGYSSLNTLKDIDVDILKIDMKFLPTGESNGKSEKILTSIIRMAGWLGIDVVVEGVETIAQKNFLISIGCGYVQGFYFARPMPVEEYEKNYNSIEDLHRAGSEKTDSDYDVFWSSSQQVDELLKGINLPVAIYEYDHQYLEPLRVNKAFFDEFGNQMHLSGSSQFQTQDSYEQVRNTFEAVFQQKKDSEVEFPYMQSDGRYMWYRMKLKYLRQINETVLICGVLMDITQEKLMEGKINQLLENYGEERAKKKMLVIDDMEVSREILSLMFEEDFEVLEATNGEEGLKILSENAGEIAIILLDMIMPEMDGAEFLAHKNKIEEERDIPVIVISAESKSEVQLNMLKMGVNDYITKPFIPEVAKKRVENVLEYNTRFRGMMREYLNVRKDTENNTSL